MTMKKRQDKWNLGFSSQKTARSSTMLTPRKSSLPNKHSNTRWNKSTRKNPTPTRKEKSIISPAQ